ncbi:hypothetical protein P7H43_01465 [Enterococcus asini]|uniref:Uncharacterized protein n=1 Tax=Enterococcus asini TaxID=57732 RepID=A0AAW8TU01_9ENTE|nr:hypothetical protein [Enterococcus asini]MDT2809159.1 hypothetical protein [Enterococcus asini]
MRKSLRFLLNFISLLVIICIITYLAIGLIIFFSNQISFNKEASVINELEKIDYGLFLRVGFATLLVSGTISSVISQIIYFVFKLSEDQLSNLVLRFFKIVAALSVVVPMIFALTKEQFEIATTFISFIAIFSFVMPSKGDINLVKKIRNKDNPNNVSTNKNEKH